MPSFAELMYQSTEKGVAEAQQATTQAIELGLRAEQLQQSKQELQSQKEQLELQRYETFAQSVEKGYKLEGQARSNYFKKYLPQRMALLGMGPDKFNPAVLDMITGDPNSVLAIAQARELVQNGSMTPTQVQQLFVDPEAWAEQAPILIDDYKVALDRKAKVEAQEAQLGAQKKRQEERITAKAIEAETKRKTTAQVAASGKIGAEFSQYTQGGPAKYEKAIKGYEEVIEDLKTGKVKFGGFKKLPWMSEEQWLARFDEKAKAAVDKIRANINIRAATGDPNPTAQYINQILSRSIDPALSNEENIKKLQDEVERMKMEERDKVNTYVREGLMPAQKETFEIDGKVISLQQMTDAYNNAKDKEAFLNKASVRTGQSIEQLKQKMGVK